MIVGMILLTLVLLLSLRVGVKEAHAEHIDALLQLALCRCHMGDCFYRGVHHRPLSATPPLLPRVARGRMKEGKLEKERWHPSKKKEPVPAASRCWCPPSGPSLTALGLALLAAGLVTQAVISLVCLALAVRGAVGRSPRGVAGGQSTNRCACAQSANAPARSRRRRAPSRS